jgi:surface-anchored protein
MRRVSLSGSGVRQFARCGWWLAWLAVGCADTGPEAPQASADGGASMGSSAPMTLATEKPNATSSHLAAVSNRASTDAAPSQSAEDAGQWLPNDAAFAPDAFAALDTGAVSSAEREAAVVDANADGSSSDGALTPDTGVPEPADAGMEGDAAELACAQAETSELEGASIVLSEGHTDVFTVSLDCAQTEFKLSVGEQDRDTQSVVQRTFDSVLIQGGESALWEWPEDVSELPPGFEWLSEPGESFWLLPEVQLPNVIWAGYQAYGIPPEALPEAHFDLELVDVDGPGKFNLFSSGIGYGLEFMFSPEQGIWTWRAEAGVHVHFNWAFSERGLYKLTFRANGTLTDGTAVTSDDYQLRVFIGELEDLPQTEPTVLKIAGARASYAVGDIVELHAELYGAPSALPIVWYSQCEVEGNSALLTERVEVGRGATFQLPVELDQCGVQATLLDGDIVRVASQRVGIADFIDWSTFTP